MGTNLEYSGGFILKALRNKENQHCPKSHRVNSPRRRIERKWRIVHDCFVDGTSFVVLCVCGPRGDSYFWNTDKLAGYNPNVQSRRK